MQSNLEGVRGEQRPSQARTNIRCHRLLLAQSVKQPVQNNLESVREVSKSRAKLHSSTEYHRRSSRQSVRQPVQSNLESVKGEQGVSQATLSTLNTTGTLCARA